MNLFSSDNYAKYQIKYVMGFHFSSCRVAILRSCLDVIILICLATMIAVILGQYSAVVLMQHSAAVWCKILSCCLGAIYSNSLDAILSCCLGAILSLGTILLSQQAMLTVFCPLEKYCTDINFQLRNVVGQSSEVWCELCCVEYLIDGEVCCDVYGI